MGKPNDCAGVSKGHVLLALAIVYAATHEEATVHSAFSEVLEMFDEIEAWFGAFEEEK